MATESKIKVYLRGRFFPVTSDWIPSDQVREAFQDLEKKFEDNLAFAFSFWVKGKSYSFNWEQVTHYKVKHR